MAIFDRLGYRIYKAIFYWSVCCSKKTALLVIDNITEGPNAVVTTWRAEMEELCKVDTQRVRRTMAASWPAFSTSSCISLQYEAFTILFQ
jgi:hypothetical protein